MIPKCHLITLNQVMIKIFKTMNSLIFPVPCNVRLTVRASCILYSIKKPFFPLLHEISTTQKLVWMPLLWLSAAAPRTSSR